MTPETVEAITPSTAPDLEGQLGRVSEVLANSREVPEDVNAFMDQLFEAIASSETVQSLKVVDQDHVVALFRGAMGSARAAHLTSSPQEGRRIMRVAVEEMRQALRGMIEGVPVQDDQPINEVANWLINVVHAPRAKIAELIGAHPSTLRRWISAEDQLYPSGDEARRLRIVALIANQLRHSLTGLGVLRWFELPHPQLDGRKPLDLLDDPSETDRLVRLAATTRRSGAS